MAALVEIVVAHLCAGLEALRAQLIVLALCAVKAKRVHLGQAVHAVLLTQLCHLPPLSCSSPTLAFRPVPSAGLTAPSAPAGLQASSEVAPTLERALLGPAMSTTSAVHHLRLFHLLFILLGFGGGVFSTPSSEGFSVPA